MKRIAIKSPYFLTLPSVLDWVYIICCFGVLWPQTGQQNKTLLFTSLSDFFIFFFTLIFFAAKPCTRKGVLPLAVSVCACVWPQGVLCRGVHVSDLFRYWCSRRTVSVCACVWPLRILMLKAYCVGVCVCLTSSDLDPEGVLCRCVRVSELFGYWCWRRTATSCVGRFNNFLLISFSKAVVN